ncbi:MAG: DNA glycosylase [Bacilli bacterium]
MIRIKTNNFNLKSTLLSGQSFRVEEYEKGFIIILDDRVVYVYMDNFYLIAVSNNENKIEEKLINYFDLLYDYESLFKIEDEITLFNRGYKILNQNKFETFISYIISQNNNVKRISNIINNISKDYGQEVIFMNKKYYLFPKYEVLRNITVNDLSKYKTGFRDKYIINGIKFLNNNINLLSNLELLTTKDASLLLQTIKGIGPKVASCILLFSYHRFDSYPVDTYVLKYMKEVYNITSKKIIEEKMHSMHGNNCGIYIQYIYNYRRNN